MNKFFLPAAAIDQHIAMLGKTGSGKTWTAKLIVEHVLRQHRQVCVIDPTAAWWGLRLAADGKGKGFDVVLLGGEHGDIPLAERSGAAVARLVTEQGASVVLDTSGMTVGEYTRWFIDFAGTLYTTLRNPLHLVIDEAHYFAPQGRVPDPDAGRMLHAANRLMSGGRSRGVRGLLVTQRPAKLHKDALTCADSLIAMRVIAPQDRGAIKDWIDGCGNAADGKTVLDSLAQLQRGEGWVWYPEGGHLKREVFPPITTYDSSAAPKYGATAPKLGEINLTEVQKALAEAVKEAEANDPKLLRKKIAELQKQLADRPSAEKVVEREKIVEVPVLKNGQLTRTEKIIDRVEAQAGKMLAEVAELKRLVAPAAATPMAPKSANNIHENIHRRTAPPPKRPDRRPQLSATPAADVTQRQQRFLDAAATLTALGTEVTRETVSAWVGVHPRGGSVGEELKALEGAGLIVIDRGQIQVTNAGMASAGQLDATEAIDRAKGGLSARQARFFEIICGVYPDGITREAIAEQVGLHPRGGSLGEDLGRLVGRGLVERQRGEFRARDFLFAASH